MLNLFRSGKKLFIQVRHRHAKLRGLRQKTVELFLKSARRRPAGWQLMKDDFEYFCLHGFVSINSARQPRLTLRTRVCSRFGKFIIVHHENALERIRPASG